MTTAGGVTGAPITIGSLSGGCWSPDIATLADGRQVIVFEEFLSVTDNDIFLNVLKPDGSLLVPASMPLVVESNTSRQSQAAVAAGPSDALVVYMDSTGGANAGDGGGDDAAGPAERPDAGRGPERGDQGADGVRGDEVKSAPPTGMAAG